MSTSPFLKMTLLTVGQATPETTVNNALQRLENAANRKLDVTMSGGGAVVLTADQFTTYTYFNCLGATAASSLTVPLTVDGNGTLVNRLFAVNNAGAFNIVITSTGGTDVTLTGGGSGIFFCDGTNVTTIISTAAAGLTAVSGDAAPSLGGDLNSNGHNITTTGPFAIVGTTATGGSSSWRMSPSGGGITISGAFNVIGNVTISGTTTLNNTVTVNGTLNVSGTTNLGAVTVSGNLTLNVGTALQNVVTDGSKNLTTEAAIYDITPFFGTKPTISGGLMGRMIIGRNISLASGAVGWQAYAGVPATDATKTVDIRKNGVSIGSITFTTGANTGSFTFATTTTFSAGDRLEFYAPATQDSALADLSFFIKGTRTLP